MEVQAKLEPLRLAVEAQGRTLRSLYSNGSGGPPGYLENARAEDKAWKDEMFDKLDDFLSRLSKVENFVVAHQATENQIEENQKELNRRLNVKLVIGGLALSAVSLLSANMASCKKAGVALFSDDNNHHPVLPSSQSADSR